MILNVFSYTPDAEFTTLIIFSLVVSVELNDAVYVQSVATPIKATFLVVGHPSVLPMVDRRFTPAELPPPGMPGVSSCLFPKRDGIDTEPQYPGSRFQFGGE